MFFNYYDNNLYWHLIVFNNNECLLVLFFNHTIMSVIFIPTDFQVGFLQIIPALSKAIDSVYTNIIIGHLFKAKDYEQLYWKKSIDFKKIDPFFIRECENSFSIKNCLSIRNFAGSSISGLKIFLEINHVDIILNPVDYSFKKISKYSIGNPGKIIRRCGYPVYDIHTICEPECNIT